jgi:thiol:disulfide interchange protein DsbD
MRSWIRRGALSVAIVAAVLVLAGTAHADPLADLEAPFREALESESLLVALGLVFVAGLATSLTPCVYPMIVITVSVFGARQAESKAQAALLSTCFVLGIAALFTPLGMIAGATGDMFGGGLSNPWVLGVLAVIFVGLALSMFGAFELTLPPALQNRLAQVGGVGYKGAFALGFVCGLIAAPCVGPVLGFLLGWIGTSGNVAFGGIALFVYSLGLGLLFFVVGTFAVSLPKSGRWLEYVKSVFGVVMIAVAVYFLRDLLPFERPRTRAAWMLGAAAGLVVVGLIAGAVHLSYHGASKLVFARKTLGIGAAVVGITLGVFWLEAMEPLPPDARIAWMHDYDEAKTLASRDGRPMMVDFTASWCGACGELDRHTFSDPRVVAEARARSLVPVKVDLSPGQDTPERRAALASYSQRGLPLVVLHDSSGEEVARVTSFMDADRFLQILEAVD